MRADSSDLRGVKQGVISRDSGDLGRVKKAARLCVKLPPLLPRW